MTAKRYDDWPLWAQMVTQFLLAPACFVGLFLGMILLGQWLVRTP